MTDEEGKVKETGGGGVGAKTGLIAVATALIGGLTTITVAYINKDDPAPVVAEKKTEPANIGGNSGNGTESGGAKIDPPAKGPGTTPPPAQQTNVAGLWLSTDGERLQIAQQGSQITVNASGQSEIGMIVAQGLGQISGRDLTWTAQSNINGQMVEMECSARLTSAGSSIQGNCNILGTAVPFIYSR